MGEIPEFARGESQVLEFKRSLSMRDAGIESLCGMVNTADGYGSVVFGVGPDGKVVGVEHGDLDKAQRSIAQSIKGNVEPPLNPTIIVEDVSGKPIIILSAKRAKDVPFHEFSGRAFIREGTTTRRLTLEEKASFSRRRNRDNASGPWQCSGPCGGIAQFYAPGLGIDGRGGITKDYRCSCGGEWWPI